MSATNVHLWHPDDPYLHFIRTEVAQDGKVVDSLRTRFGIRLFEMRGADGFFVNKKYIGHKLSGVNHHEDYVYVGNAVPNSSSWRDVKLLREGGSDVVRTSHYPQDPAFMDACDELGMLVIRFSNSASRRTPRPWCGATATARRSSFGKSL